MAVLLNNAWLEVTTLPLAGAVLLVRSACPITNEKELDASWGALLRTLESCDASLDRLLMDMSAAPNEPHPRFASDVFAHLAAISGRFERVAVIVRTREAQLRVGADAEQNDMPGVRGFTDVTSAMAWLSKSRR